MVGFPLDLMFLMDWVLTKDSSICDPHRVGQLYRAGKSPCLLPPSPHIQNLTENR